MLRPGSMCEGSAIHAMKLNIAATAVVVVATIAAGGGIAGGNWASAATGSGQAAATAPTGPGGTWGSAIQLGQGNAYSFAGLSCVSPGNCTVVANWEDSLWPVPHAATETDGIWGPVTAIAGTTPLGSGYEPVSSVSCTAPGDCSAIGYYYASLSVPNRSTYVIDETNGVWGSPVTLAGVTTESGVAVSYPVSISCSSPGYCSAVGEYSAQAVAQPTQLQAFAVTETGGKWSATQQVTGVTSGATVVRLSGVSCAAAGECTAVGAYNPASGSTAFAVSESGGTWNQSQQLPFPASDGLANISCTAPGDCTASGYTLATGPFVVDETSGTWDTPQVVSFPVTYSYSAQIDAISCTSPGSCAVGGSIANSDLTGAQPFTAEEAGGTLDPVTMLSGSMPGRPWSGVTAISCAPGGYCAAGGSSSGDTLSSALTSLPFVAGNTGGWSSFAEVPGFAAFGTNPDAGIDAMSCPAAGYCTAVGHTYAGLEFAVDEATSSTTTLAASMTKEGFGANRPVTVTAKVSSTAGGTATGGVVFTAGGVSVCTAALTAGTASCTIATTRFPVGTTQLRAVYSGDDTYLTSASSVAFTVTKATTRTTLALSRNTIAYGSEGVERLSVAVAPQYSGIPAGKVTIKAGRTGLCAITLKSGKGSCTLAARQLTTGTYTLSASFAGNASFLLSTSAGRKLVVVK